MKIYVVMVTPEASFSRISQIAYKSTIRSTSVYYGPIWESAKAI